MFTPVLETHHVVTDHTKHNDGMHFPLMDAIGHIVYQLTRQDFAYNTDYYISSIDTNTSGHRVITIGWLVERKAMIARLSGVTDVYGERK